MVKCPFHTLTGLQCPACGNQRALHSLLHLDLAQAWAYNPFLLISLPYIIPLTLSWLFENRMPKTWKALSNKHVVLTYAAAIVLWFILRNLVTLSL